eukprot:CAMPEP_0116132696 /NCGR_PEP_ID=MMETSP0329-20121206/9695_1 /TAXON_ID=697910 /ORGANISM="Pseudo-nitzschia arenysensis, Strain B593" /LENGTH=377 /DNA_ID=CAMNT_0003627247 /DNA_START=113 /DNA_END=1246 /DNA_ORIENTATION=+
MASFLMLVAMTMLTVDSARFLPVPAFHNSIDNKPTVSSKVAFVDVASLEQQAKLLSVRGGAKDEEEKEDDDDDDENDEDEAEDAEVEEEEEFDETEDGPSDDDEDEYYDDESEEEEDSTLATQLKKKSSKNDKSDEATVEPYFISPSLQMYTTFGTILLSRKIDMFNPTVVRMIRTLFVFYLLVQQAFIFYVRIMAKRNNDRRPVQVQNPLSSMLSSQLEKQQAGGSDMVKNLASNFLKTDSTVVEYDMGQATNMQGGILFNLVFMWILHFKMSQVQPLLVTSVSGFVQLVYNPLFQVYVLGRNLERPFKSPAVFKDPRAQEETEETTTEDETTDSATKESDEEEKEDESSDDDDEDSSDDEDDDEDDDGDDEDESE